LAPFFLESNNKKDGYEKTNNYNDGSLCHWTRAECLRAKSQHYAGWYNDGSIDEPLRQPCGLLDLG